MKHHFKVGDLVVGYSAKTDRTNFYDILAVTGDDVTLSRSYSSRKNAEPQVFTIAGPDTLDTCDLDKTLELMRTANRYLRPLAVECSSYKRSIHRS
jgi:hypothetical protein